MYDAQRNIVYRRKPSSANKDEVGSISLNDIDSIKFETNNRDGFIGFFKVAKNGSNEAFHCVDCLSTSSSTELSRLYLDTDMSIPQDLPKTAYCQNKCTFEKGPPPVNSGNIIFLQMIC